MLRNSFLESRSAISQVQLPLVIDLWYVLHRINRLWGFRLHRFLGPIKVVKLFLNSWLWLINGHNILLPWDIIVRCRNSEKLRVFILVWDHVMSKLLISQIVRSCINTDLLGFGTHEVLSNPVLLLRAAV